MTTEHQSTMRRNLVHKIKGDWLANGADPGIEPVSTFFENLDYAAALHIN